MSLKVGVLFAGYGGIELGLSRVLDVETAWVAEFDPGASRVLAHRFPGIPNHGDVTSIDWSAVEPVDIITGGSPCQDLSYAGRRAGMSEGTRSNLWVAMREAIAVIRPSLVVWENVRGSFSAPADSAMEPCPGCVGDGSGEPALRALGRVLGDLADLGYDARWYGLRAADVGGAHGRFRVFVFATQRGDRRPWVGRGQPARRLPLGGVSLFPTPTVSDMGEGKTVEAWDAWTARMKGEHGNGNGHGRSLAIETLRLLPTPAGRDGDGRGGSDPATRQAVGHQVGLDDAVKMLPTPRATDGTKGGPNQRGSSGDLMLTSAVRLLPTPAKGSWGEYAAAIARCERTWGRPAPEPTITAHGTTRLNAAFSEWLMGLPDGWVTDPAIWDGMTDARGNVLTGKRLYTASRNAQLRILGNGVVPPQIGAAARAWLEDIASEVAA